MNSTQAQNGIALKIFVGCQINSEVRMHLNHSEQWKQAQVIRCADGKNLEEIRYQEKNFIGTLLPNNQLPFSALRREEDKVKQALASYCPELNVEKLKIFVFPQLFLS